MNFPPMPSPTLMILIPILLFLIGGAFVILLPLLLISWLGKRGQQNAQALKPNFEQTQSTADNPVSDVLSGLARLGLETKQRILNENADTIRDVKTTEATLMSPAIETAVRAVKHGLTEEDHVYCQHCRAVIDADSSFCKACGNHQ